MTTDGIKETNYKTSRWYNSRIERVNNILNNGLPIKKVKKIKPLYVCCILNGVMGKIHMSNQHHLCKDCNPLVVVVHRELDKIEYFEFEI